MYISIHMYVYIYIYIYIYIVILNIARNWTSGVGDRAAAPRTLTLSVSTSIVTRPIYINIYIECYGTNKSHIYIYTCVYIYIYRERERYTST